MLRSLAVGSLIVGLTACSSGSGDPGSSASSAGTAAGGSLATVVDDVIVPRYEAFRLAAADLEGSIGALCSQPDQAALDAARQVWVDARSSWRRTLAFGIGPAMTLRTKSAVDFAPSEAKVQEVLDSSEPVTAESVADLGASARGLGAIEHLLYGPGSEALAGPDGARRCAYAAAAAGLVVTAADDITAAWAQGAEGRDEFVADETMAMNDLFNQMVGTLQVVADRHLTRAVGGADGTPDPAAADPGPAQRALDDMVDDLDGTIAAYDAVLAPPLEQQSAEAATRTRAGLVEGQEALRALPRPMAAAVETELPAARAAMETLKEVKRTLATEVASLLGLTLTFSESDGDA